MEGIVDVFALLLDALLVIQIGPAAGGGPFRTDIDGGVLSPVQDDLVYLVHLLADRRADRGMPEQPECVQQFVPDLFVVKRIGGAIIFGLNDLSIGQCPQISHYLLSPLSEKY